MNTPLFRSAHDALVFAFNYSSQQYGKTPMSKVAVPASGSGKGLSGTDGAAQSGMIRLEVSALGKLPEAILIARFAPHTMSCSCRSSCCSGKEPNREWSNAISYLAQYLEDVTLKDCYTTWDMRMQYVMRQFLKKDQRVSLDEIAKRNDVTERTAISHSQIVSQFFNGYRKEKERVPGMEELARSEIERRLLESGMVGG